MGQIEIQDKLRKFLTREQPFLEEKDVVYFLVEARKIIYHENAQQRFPAIKFYADWTVHIRKDYVPEFIEKLVQQSSGKIDKFINMNYLKQEMKNFLNTYRLSETMINETNWKVFWKKLVCVLSEQPLILKGPMTEFKFCTTGNEDMITVQYDEV